MSHPFSSANELPFFFGEGEMGALMREKEWGHSLLGLPQQWDPQLKHLIATILGVPSPMLICWGNEFIQFYNDAFRPILGNNKHPHALGISASETYSEIWDTIKPLFEKVLQGEPVKFHDLKLVMDRNGFPEEVYFDFTYSPIRDENGVVKGIMVICAETTLTVNYLSNLSAANMDLKNAEKNLSKEKERLERFFIQAPAAICILNGPDLIYELVNPTYQNLFPGRELLNKPISIALPEIVGNPVYDTFLSVYETGVTHQENDLYIPIMNKKNGVLEDRYFKYIQQARFDEYGKVDGVLVFAFEVTEQVISRLELEKSKEELYRIYQELSASNEELQSAHEELFSTNEELSKTNIKLNKINSDLDNFVYAASHDLKSPVSNIEGLISAMQDIIEEEEINKESLGSIVDYIHHSVNRFKKTILDLTDISRIEYSVSGEKAFVSLEEVISEVQFDQQKSITDSNATFIIDLENCPKIFISPKNLRSIVYNLISNAIKYCHPERSPVIQIACYLENGYHVLCISDNGLGINMANKDKLFLMFSRLHNHVEGTGVGLYMVKRMIENEGGKIEVESSLNQGSVFKVYFKNSN